MTDRPDAVSQFWQSVGLLLPRLRSESDEEAYDAALAALHAVDPGLYLEISNCEPKELIVTADGDPQLFQLARTVVAAAPSFQGWMIHALRPKVGLPDHATWNDLSIEIADVYFDPLESVASTQLGLRLYVRGLSEERFEDAHNALLRAMDHILGEERFGNSVFFTEVQAFSEHGSPSDWIPLAELDAFLEWREKRRN